jgi:hypothetical protein
MQVWDQVKVKNAPAGDEDSNGRAGVITKIEGADGPDQQITVKLDETETHEGGEEVYSQSALEFLGR